MPIRPPIQIWKNLRELSRWCQATTATPDADSITSDMLQAASVTNAKLRDSAATSVIGRAAASAGTPTDISATTNGHVLQRLAGILQFAVLNASNVAFTPTGGISATFVDTALAELDSEKLATASYTAADVLAKLLTVDGAGSGLDADLLDGQSSAYYLNASNINAGTLDDARIPSGIARDAEVTAAIAAHVAAADPHPGYPLAASPETISGAWAFSLPPVMPTYTVATLPSAATYARGLIYVSDETGGAVIAFSDGSNWRRVTDRAVVA